MSTMAHGGRGEDSKDRPQYYVLQVGDNESVSHHVLNSFKARTGGMRRVAAERMREDARRPVISLSAHVKRDYNQEADALANMDIEGFVNSDFRLLRIAELP